MSRDGEQTHNGRPKRPSRGSAKAEPPLKTSLRSSDNRSGLQQRQQLTTAESSNWRNRRRDATGDRIKEDRAARQLVGRGGEDGMMSVVYRAERQDQAAAMERAADHIKITEEDLNEDATQPQANADQNEQETIEARDMEHLVATYYDHDAHCMEISG